MDRPAVLLDTRPAAAVADDAVGLRPDDAFDVLDRIFRRDDLREVVPVAALVPVFVTVTGSEFAPIIGQVTIRRVHFFGGTRFVVRLGLAPDADIGVVFPDPGDEIVVVVTLIGPHAVLDVPIEQTHVVRPFAAAPGQQRRSQQRRPNPKKSFSLHHRSCFIFCGNNSRHSRTTTAPCCRRYS